MFGYNVTGKHPSTAKGMLAEVAYSRINMHPLPNDRLPADMEPDGVLNALIEDAKAYSVAEEAKAVSSHLTMTDGEHKEVDQMTG